MMTDWTRIDDYFANRLTVEERSRFEASLRTDPELADATALYLSAREVARQQAQAERRAELLARRPRTARRLTWPYAIAAAASVVLLLGLAWLFWPRNTPASELADDYINQHFTQLSVTMSANADSIQLGIDLANQGKLDQADAWFSSILQRNPTQADALRYAGIVALRQGNLDTAIGRFNQLGRRTDLFANPGYLYEAIARLKRNKPNDKNTAKALLQNVVKQNLEGLEDAKVLLEKL